MSKYSVIVIGAGLGGLGAATQLTLAGEKILVLEKNPVPGGFATSFVRGRFEFEGALHELSGLGTKDNPGGLYHYFTELGIIEKLQFCYAPEMYSSVFYDGKKYDLPFGFDAYENYLIEQFPENVKAIKKCMKAIKNIHLGITGPLKPFRILFKYPWVIRALGLDVQTFLRKFLKNQRIINVIQQLFGYLADAPSNCNVLLYIGALTSYMTKGAAYPSKRSHYMSQLLADYVTSHGGEILYNALVDHIIVENGKVTGVALLNGIKFYADAVISNVNPVCVISKMMPEGTFSESFIRRVTSPPMESSIFTVYLGLNKTYKELGLTSYETFINTIDDFDKAALETGIEHSKLIVACCHNIVNPSISPPGTCMIELSALHCGREWQSISPTDYHHVKDKVANDLIKIFEKLVCPKIRDAIEVLEIASPLTYYRYSKQLDGTIYGTNSDILDSPAFKLGVTTPLPNFYFCGCWTYQGGGYDPSFNSGRIAAQNFLQRKLNTLNSKEAN